MNHRSKRIGMSDVPNLTQKYVAVAETASEVVVIEVVLAALLRLRLNPYCYLIWYIMGS